MFYAEKGFENEPQRCRDCRNARKSQRTAAGAQAPSFGSGTREMFDAVCAQCGENTTVPFRPRGDRPVYCRTCYSAQNAVRALERSPTAVPKGTAVDSVWFDGDAVGYVDQRALPQRVVRARAASVDAIVDGDPNAGGARCAGDRRSSARTASRWRSAARRRRVPHAAARDPGCPADGRQPGLGGRPRPGARRRRLARRGGGDPRRAAGDRRADRPACGGALPRTRQRADALQHRAAGDRRRGDGARRRSSRRIARARRCTSIVDETRPLLQGARLTMFELRAAGVPCTLIVDAAAAVTMREKDIRAVVVGADRIARNGDTANKIGTYGVAIAAAYHRIPFYVAAPRSTFDFDDRRRQRDPDRGAAPRRGPDRRRRSGLQSRVRRDAGRAGRGHRHRVRRPARPLRSRDRRAGAPNADRSREIL